MDKYEVALSDGTTVGIEGDIEIKDGYFIVSNEADVITWIFSMTNVLFVKKEETENE